MREVKSGLSGGFWLSLNISETESFTFSEKAWPEWHFRDIFKEKRTTLD